MKLTPFYVLFGFIFVNCSRQIRVGFDIYKPGLNILLINQNKQFYLVSFGSTYNVNQNNHTFESPGRPINGLGPPKTGYITPVKVSLLFFLSFSFPFSYVLTH